MVAWMSRKSGGIKWGEMSGKQERRNQTPFMTKELSKAVMTRSMIKNKYNK